MEDLADVWPEGGLFAFSGIDGETCHAEPFVASGLKQAIGWSFWLKPALSLQMFAGRTPLVPRRTPGDFCLSDCWRVTTQVGDQEGLVAGAFLDHHTLTIVAVFKQLDGGVYPEIAAPTIGQLESGAEIFSGDGWWVALCREPEGLKRRFGIAISYRDAADAVERASRACSGDMAEIIQRRLAFYRGISVPESLSGNSRRTYYKAVSVFKVNTESAQDDIPYRWLTPDRMPHRHLWLWDTAFHALGLQYLSQELAQDAIRSIFAKQQPDGQLLLAVQPGNSLPLTQETQPPLLAWSVCRQGERVMNPEFLGEIYPKLVGYIEWFEANRKTPGGLYGWKIRKDGDAVRGARGAESGMDNSPRFDDIEAVTAVDLSSYMASEYHSLEKIARCLEKYPDVGEWQKRRMLIAEQVNEVLWDDETRMYFDLDEAGEFIQVKTPAGFMPLLGQIPDRDRAEALRMHLMNPNEFWGPLPVPSVSQDESSYSNDMWRGPVWMNINMLIYYGLMTYGFFQEARQLARVSVQEIVRCYMKYGCLYECYDSSTILPPAEMPRKGASGKEGGAGFGIVQDMTWTAAAYVYLTNEVS